MFPPIRCHVAQLRGGALLERDRDKRQPRANVGVGGDVGKARESANVYGVAANLDVAEAEPVDVDQQPRSFDADFHEVEHVRPTGHIARISFVRERR